MGSGGQLELVGDIDVRVPGLAVGTGLVLQKEFAECKKPPEGDEIVDFNTLVVYVSRSLPRASHVLIKRKNEETNQVDFFLVLIMKR